MPALVVSFSILSALYGRPLPIERDTHLPVGVFDRVTVVLDDGSIDSGTVIAHGVSRSQLLVRLDGGTARWTHARNVFTRTVPDPTPAAPGRAA